MYPATKKKLGRLRKTSYGLISKKQKICLHENLSSDDSNSKKLT